MSRLIDLTCKFATWASRAEPMLMWHITIRYIADMTVLHSPFLLIYKVTSFIKEKYFIHKWDINVEHKCIRINFMEIRMIDESREIERKEDEQHDSRRIRRRNPRWKSSGSRRKDNCCRRTFIQ